jgi:hypothetical protein
MRAKGWAYDTKRAKALPARGDTALSSSANTLVERMSWPWPLDFRDHLKNAFFWSDLFPFFLEIDEIA